MKKICIFTGTRADYGLLKPLMLALKKDPEFMLQLIVSGSHLSQPHGYTISEILNDGFIVDEQLEMLLQSDSPAAICKSSGLLLMGMGEALNRLKPDALIVLGDRFEALSAAISAVISHIHVFHIHGGETSLGAIDDSFRHAITKLSSLHFTSTDIYRNRVVQMGESPDRVFHVGAMGLENIRHLRLPQKAEIESDLGLSLTGKWIVSTFHPETTSPDLGMASLEALFSAIDQIPDLNVIFTRANADEGGAAINRAIEYFVNARPERAYVFSSLGISRYLGLMACVSGVVGNSSSGIIEAPSMGIPSLDIGSRQAGRVRGNSVISVSGEPADVSRGLTTLFSEDARAAAATKSNPYDYPGTCDSILLGIKAFDFKAKAKAFFDLDDPTRFAGCE